MLTYETRSRSGQMTQKYPIRGAPTIQWYPNTILRCSSAKSLYLSRPISDWWCSRSLTKRRSPMGLKGRSYDDASTANSSTLREFPGMRSRLSPARKTRSKSIARRNVEHFLPTIKRLNQWTDRKKEVEVPLFAGYCFARLSWADRLTVLQSQGVVRVVGSSARPEPVLAEEIESLRNLVNNS